MWWEIRNLPHLLIVSLLSDVLELEYILAMAFIHQLFWMILSLKHASHALQAPHFSLPWMSLHYQGEKIGCGAWGDFHLHSSPRSCIRLNEGGEGVGEEDHLSWKPCMH